MKCKEEFNEETIKLIVSVEEFAKYKKFKTNIEVNMNKRARWCPKPDCGKYALVNFGTNKCVCECGFTFCFKCGNAYHGWKSCDKVADQKFKEWSQNKKLQRCPKCKILIHKDAGCNHMTCTFCKFEFCWICGGKYTYKHFNDPLFGCPNLQFTSSDWSFTRIFFYYLLMIVIWPIYSILYSIETIVDIFRNELDFIIGKCGIILKIIGYIFAFIISYNVFLFVGYFAHFYKIIYLIYRAAFLT